MRILRALPLVLLFTLSFPALARTGQVADRIQALRTKGVVFKEVGLFRPDGMKEEARSLLDAALTKGEVLQVDPAALGAVLRLRAEHLSLSIPFEGGTLSLDLARTEIAEEAVNVVLASGSRTVGLPGVHYRGMVRGLPGSWVALSVFEQEVMLLINDGQGQIVVGPLKGDRRGRHVIYRDRDLRGSPDFVCGAQEVEGAFHNDQITLAAGDRTVRCVRYYWEVNYNVFQDKGTVANTTNYITGLFNQSAILFDNDGIDITLSELFIWDVPSPYSGPGSGDYLDQFGVTRTSFNGDMAHLIGYGGGGGVAWLNTLCNGLASYRMAYSGIGSSYNNVPTYSWSTMVVTHEAGHNLGSPHTHACWWNGNGTNIDGCGPTANSGYSEGSCPIGPIPTGVGGTIMSYCHLVSGVGINLANGFGPQPTAVIVNAVNNASCLTACGTTCDAPGTLTAINIGVTTATLSWSAVGVATFDLRWRQVGAPTWTDVLGVVGNTYSLSGLTQGTNYEFQVRSVCGGTSSPYSTTRTFTTAVPCPDVLEPNGTWATAATVGIPGTVSALIATNGDVDHYRFTIASTSTINLYLANLPYDYDLQLLTSGGAVLASSFNGGTQPENISYASAAAGDYIVQVYGYNGAFDALRCYMLEMSAYAIGCGVPDGVSVSAITYQSASISWPVVQGAASYDLRYKPAAQPTWVDVFGITAPPRVLTGLIPETTYEVQVRAVCDPPGSQGGSSEYTGTSFTTLPYLCTTPVAATCALSVSLDGPYDTATGLMHDSLRTQGLIPLQEPYSAMGYPVTGATTTTQALLDVAGPGAIVDWVLLELRQASSPFSVVDTKVALLRRDGGLRTPNGGEFIGFCAPQGSYRIAVRHRNHLGCMSGSALGLGPLPATFAFATATTYGTQAMRDRGGVSLLWAGNAVVDDEIMYTGSDNDRDAVLFVIGGSVPTNTIAGYMKEDVNLDGVVKYSGTANDRDVILNTIGGAVPTNTVQEQMP
ncbi:MAG: fibronectin type III domain-containing protein [Flavobacteriales bacterium]|nr:fibronectin type III domain-containing protein [Flavobacteriales bacterium]